MMIRVLKENWNLFKKLIFVFDERYIIYYEIFWNFLNFNNLMLGYWKDWEMRRKGIKIYEIFVMC